MTTTGVISGVSVSHSLASLDEIEAATAGDVRSVVAALLDRDGVDEAFALQTCNRAEAYVVADTAAAGRAALGEVPAGRAARDAARVELDHDAALRHLMRVAAGLESLVVGEDQILGQFKTAMAESRAVGGVGPVFDDALTKAVHVGERARTETGINEGAVSLGSAAVRLAESEAELAEATALVVGAGEMGTLAAQALDSTPVERLVVANRTVPHAEHIAGELRTEASAVGLDATPAAAATADVVVAATSSPDPVLTDAHLREAGETVLVDIAQPRDVHPDAESVDGVSVYDIDALEAVTDETRERREREAERVEALIDEEFDRLASAFKRKQADDAIGAMYEGAERIKQRELETAVTKLEAQGDLTDEQRETVGSLADALVGQLLAAPTESLREAAAEDDWSTIQTAMRLFDPDPGSEFGDASADAGPPPDVDREAGDAPPGAFEQHSDD